MSEVSASDLMRETITAAVETFMKRMDTDPSVNSLGVDYFDSGLSALYATRQSISVLITKVARRRNLLLPIHKLPGEVFLQILQFATGFNNDGWNHQIDRYHRFAQVSFLWRNSMIVSQSFWRVVGDAMARDTQDMVLRLNPNGPLVVWAGMPYSNRDPEPDTTAFLERVVPLAHRWRILIAKQPYSNQLLEHLPPTLKDLCITNTAKEIYNLPLAEGHPLRHVHLLQVSIPWDSSRLCNLQTISLEMLHRNSPTLGQIISILSSSPHLWRLSLKEWETSHLPNYTEDPTPYANTYIKLPHLSTFVASLIPTVIVSFLVNHIQTTRLSCLIANSVDSIDAVELADPGSPLLDMLKQVLQLPCIKTTSIRYSDLEWRIRIRSGPRPGLDGNLVYWAKDRPGIDLTISTPMGPLFGPMWQMLADTLAANAPCVRFDFTDQPDSTFDGELPARRVPLDLLPHLPHIRSMAFTKGFNPRSVLRYLSAPKHTVDGSTRWLCPKLNGLLIGWAVGDFEKDLEEFLRWRYLERLEAKEESQENDHIVNEGDLGVLVAGNKDDASGFTNNRYPAMLKRLLVLERFREKLQTVQGVQHLTRQGILEYI